MTEKHEKLLANLEFKIRQLMYLSDTLKAENQELKVQLEFSKTETAEAIEAFQQLNTKYNNLKSASTLSGTDNASIDKARDRLFRLVQDVDKCISLLKI